MKLQKILIFLTIPVLFGLLIGCSDNPEELNSSILTEFESSNEVFDDNTENPNADGSFEDNHDRNDEEIYSDQDTFPKEDPNEFDEHEDEQDGNVRPDGTWENPNDNVLGFSELMQVIRNKYEQKFTDAQVQFQASLQAKRIEILGEVYALKVETLSSLLTEYRSLYSDFEQISDFTSIKTMLLALSEQLQTLEKNSEEYLAIINEMEVLWESISTTVDDLAIQAQTLKQQINTLQQEINAIHLANRDILEQEMKIIRVEFQETNEAIRQAMNLEVKILKAAFNLDDNSFFPNEDFAKQPYDSAGN
jgi:hypothetical protein